MRIVHRAIIEAFHSEAMAERKSRQRLLPIGSINATKCQFISLQHNVNATKYVNFKFNDPFDSISF